MTQKVSICWAYYLQSFFPAPTSFPLVLLCHRQEWKCWSRSTMLVLIWLGSHKDCSVLWGLLKWRLSALPVEGMSLLSYTWGKGCAERVSASVRWAVPFTACAMVTLHARLPALVNLMFVCQLKSIPMSRMRLRWMAENPAEMSLGKMTTFNYVFSFVTAKIKITERIFKE